MTYLMVLVGLVLLFLGGESLVRGSVSVARKLNISELVIGLTLVGFGTSVPELVTSLRAIGQDAVGIAVGNVIGSNIANILLVLGLAAILGPIATNPRALARDSTVMIVVSLLLCGFVMNGSFSRLTGSVLVLLLAVYVLYSFYADQRKQSAAADMHAGEGESVEASYGIVAGLAIAAAGLVGVVLGARLLVDGGVSIARSIGVSETVIGLTIVAVGTSLPELATSVVAALRGKADVAIGNVIGSNIFNILGILGLTALVRPFMVRVTSEGEAVTGLVGIVAMTDLIAVLVSAALLIVFIISGKRIARWEGGLLLFGYSLYMGIVFNLIPVPDFI